MRHREGGGIGGRGFVDERLGALLDPGRLAPGRRANVAYRLLLGRLLQALGNPPLKLVLWDGQEASGGNGPARARAVIRDPGALLGLLADPEFKFGEMYVAGRIDVPGDLADFLEVVYRSLPPQNAASLREKLLATLCGVRRNTVDRAASNIYHHYDIGNAFYRLWLDERMVYTCAYFPDPAMDLEAAQLAKLDYVCRKLRLRPGERVVEAGCGWGGLALHMARRYGVSVRAYNLSREQLAYARQRAREEGLEHRVEFIEGDCRRIDGRCEAFVSVGMLEHLGVADYRVLGEVIDRCLTEDGRGLIHTIGRSYPRPMNAWIERYIFPGACPPSLSQMMAIFEPFDFAVLDIENLRLHYARTIEHWARRFAQAADRVSDMFDPAFVRAWNLYLAGSLAAFRSGDMQLFQVCFARAGSNRIPWSRRDLYPAEGGDGKL